MREGGAAMAVKFTVAELVTFRDAVNVARPVLRTEVHRLGKAARGAPVGGGDADRLRQERNALETAIAHIDHGIDKLLGADVTVRG